ncbi:MAG: hypothetical protein JNM10_00115 [Planctomycetia bacterium]|nr:hypothetical protein [Planctomycetia bacterium]
MPRVAHVWPEPVRTTEDPVTGTPVDEVAMTVEWPRRLRDFLEGPKVWRARRQRLWIRLPAGTSPSPAAVGDAAVLVALFGAMRRAHVLHVHGEVTAERLPSATTLAEVWHRRRPDKYRVPTLRADRATPAVAARGPAILPFSGGLDSAYSLLRYAGPGRGPDVVPVATAMMVAGADVPVDEHEAFGRAFARAQHLTDSLGVPLVRVTTNLRTAKQNWTHSNNTALAALTGLFRATHGLGLLAVGFTAAEAKAWWPADVEDPLHLSTPAFPVLADGHEADRFEKLVAVGGWPEALAHLRVCFRPGVWDRNCADCFKCLTVMLFARLAFGGAIPAFPREFTDADLDRIVAIRDHMSGIRLRQFARHARALGSADPLVARVEAALARFPDRGAA